MTTFAVHTEERKTNLELLNEIIKDSVKQIEAIDVALEELVNGGLKGDAVQTMSATYIKNRETISELLKEFAKKSRALRIQEEQNAQVDAEASENAMGNN